MLGRLRRNRGRETVAGHYARVLDGETLWLVVDGAPPTVTLRYDGGELVEPTEPEGRLECGALVGARVPLAPLAEVPEGSGPLQVEVLAGDGRHTAPITWEASPPPGPVRAAIPTRDRRWRWRVAAPDGHLALVREPVAPGVVVEAVEALPDGVRLVLAGAGALEVSASDVTPPDGEPLPLLVDGVPLVRARDDLKRPAAAVALPDPAEGLRLRWQPDGTLAVVRAR